MKNLCIAPFVRRLLAAGLLLTAAALPAVAETLTFNNQAPAVLEGGEFLQEAGYTLTALEGPVTAAYGLHSGTGAILDPSDPFSCELISCPVGDGSRYYAVENDGGVRITENGGKSFQLKGLDFGFIAPYPVTDGVYGQLLLTAVRSGGGGSISLALDFPGQDGYGNFTFGAAALGALQGVQLSSVTLSACVFIDDATCVNSLDQPAFNQAQFGLDNISVSAVPEPSVWLMLTAGLGLGLLAWMRRRSGPRAMLAASLLAGLAGAAGGAQAHITTFTGDTTGGPVYHRPETDGVTYYDWRGETAYRAYDFNLKEATDLINIGASCDFDCAIFFYTGAFNPAAPSDHFKAGDDYFLTNNTAELGGPLAAGHYTLVVTGNSASDFGFFSTTVAYANALEITPLAPPVPEPSAWLMLGAGLAALGLWRMRRMPRLQRSQRTAKLLRFGLVALLLAGTAQQATAALETFTGDTTWGDSFAPPDVGAGESSPGGHVLNPGAVVRYRAFALTASATDWQYSILSVCDFRCTTYLYRDSFNPQNPIQNLWAAQVPDWGMSGVMTDMDAGRRYVLVIAGYQDYDWGAFSTTIGGLGTVTISAVPEPSFGLMLLLGLGGMAVAARRRAARA